MQNPSHRAKLCARNGLRIDAEGRTFPGVRSCSTCLRHGSAGFCANRQEGGIGSRKGSKAGGVLLPFSFLVCWGWGAKCKESVIGPKIRVCASQGYHMEILFIKMPQAR
jgi:hypothetical protein